MTYEIIGLVKKKDAKLDATLLMNNYKRLLHRFMVVYIRNCLVH